jgi:hypothetical protein
MRSTLVEQAFVWFLRLVAGYCLFFGILYWVRLIGVYDGPLWRFDLMPLHWQVAAVTLAALFPFAAIGLWMLASWGPVIWVICAVTEAVMYFVFPDLYGHRLLNVSSHLAVAQLYTAFRLLIYWQRRRAEQYG